MDNALIQRCPACGTRNRIAHPRLLAQARCGRCKSKVFPPEPVAVTDSSFADLVESSAVPVLVDYWAPWCGPCAQIDPMLCTIARERAGQVRIAKINVDDNPAIARRFTIRSIPALKLFKSGQIVGELTGVVPASAITELLDQHVRENA